MPGPAPKDPNHKFIKLPAEGRKGRAPVWPLEDQTAAEKSMWRSLWSTPQAVMWERQQVARTVARFCRLAVEAERPAASTRLLAEVRQMEHDLGLTPISLMRLRWAIATDEVAEKREGTKRQRAPLTRVS